MVVGLGIWVGVGWGEMSGHGCGTGLWVGEGWGEMSGNGCGIGWGQVVKVKCWCKLEGRSVI